MQSPSFRTDVADLHDPIVSQALLDVQGVHLVVGRTERLADGKKVKHIASRDRHRPGWEDGLVLHDRVVIRLDAENRIVSCGIIGRAERSIVQEKDVIEKRNYRWSVEKDPIRATNHQIAAVPWLVGKTNPRAEVQEILGVDCGNALPGNDETARREKYGKILLVVMQRTFVLVAKSKIEVHLAPL